MRLITCRWLLNFITGRHTGHIGKMERSRDTSSKNRFVVSVIYTSMLIEIGTIFNIYKSISLSI